MIIQIIIDIIAWMSGRAAKPFAARFDPRFTARRIVAAIAAVAFGAFTLLVLITQLRSRFEPLVAILGSFPATAAILCGWFALRGHLPQSRLHWKFTMRGGLIGRLGTPRLTSISHTS